MAGQDEGTNTTGSRRRSLLDRLFGATDALFSGLVDRSHQGHYLVLIFAAYIVLWTLYAIAAKSTQDIHPDTAELLVWSRELALGYWKHPPFAVYVVKAWTTLFPVDDWSFYLLGISNAALALWITWCLLSALLGEEKRALGLILLTLLPFYNLMSIRFNHNTVQMTLWAATTLFFFRSYTTGHVGFAALAGLAAGLAMLSKYWSIMLLAGLALAAITDQRRGEYFRSASPWITILVGLVVIAPHLAWLFQNQFSPFTYATTVNADGSIVSTMIYALKYLPNCVIFLSPVLIAAAFSLTWSRAALWDSLFPSTPDRRFVAIAFWVPLLLPIPVTILSRTDLDSQWVIPQMALLPAVLLSSPLLTVGRKAAARITALAIALPFAALLCSPLVALDGFLRPNPNGSAHFRVLAASADRMWRDQTALPLKLVVGEWKAAAGIAFYSSERPMINPANMTQRAIDDGVLAVCRGGRSECSWIRARLPVATPSDQLQEVTFSRQFLGFTKEPVTFSIMVLPPVGKGAERERQTGSAPMR